MTLRLFRDPRIPVFFPMNSDSNFPKFFLKSGSRTHLDVNGCHIWCPHPIRLNVRSHPFGNMDNMDVDDVGFCQHHGCSISLHYSKRRAGGRSWGRSLAESRGLLQRQELRALTVSGWVLDIPTGWNSWSFLVISWLWFCGFLLSFCMVKKMSFIYSFTIFWRVCRKFTDLQTMSDPYYKIMGVPSMGPKNLWSISWKVLLSKFKLIGNSRNLTPFQTATAESNPDDHPTGSSPNEPSTLRRSAVRSWNRGQVESWPPSRVWRASQGVSCCSTTGATRGKRGDNTQVRTLVRHRWTDVW